MKLPRILGGKKAATQIMSMVIGEDRTLVTDPIDATGIEFINDKNKLGYDALTDTVASFYEIRNGRRKYLGQIAVLLEPMARPFSFDKLTWVDKERINKKSVVLSTARSEAAAMVVQRIVRDDRRDRLSTALILIICLFGVMVLLYLIQSGVFAKLIG